MPRLHRKNAMPFSALVKQFINENRLRAGINSSCIFSAWDKASGCGEYTEKRFFKEGILYITMCSSVVASQLFFQREDIMKRMNALLAEDELFQGEPDPVKKINVK